MFGTQREQSRRAPQAPAHAPAVRKDIEVPVVVAGRETGDEQRDIFNVPLVPSSVDFEGTVESVALAQESHIEISLWEDERRLAAVVVPVRADSQRPVHLRGISSRPGVHELRVRARVGAASVRGRIQVESIVP
ncbi:MAG TPA: hypothetical protein VGB18_04600 [Candidatus Thermoplasmatota archaeon]